MSTITQQKQHTQWMKVCHSLFNSNNSVYSKDSHNKKKNAECYEINSVIKHQSDVVFIYNYAYQFSVDENVI